MDWTLCCGLKTIIVLESTYIKLQKGSPADSHLILELSIVKLSKQNLAQSFSKWWLLILIKFYWKCLKIFTDLNFSVVIKLYYFQVLVASTWGILKRRSRLATCIDVTLEAAPTTPEITLRTELLLQWYSASSMLLMDPIT